MDKIAIAFQDAAHYFPDKKTVLVGNPRGQEVKTVRSLRSLLPMTLTLRKNCFSLWRQSRSTENQSSDYRSNSAFAKKDYQLLYASGDRYYQEIEEKIGMSKDAFQISAFAPTSIKWQKSWRIVTC